MAEKEFRVVISGDILNCLINSLMALAVNQYRQGIVDKTVAQPNFDFIIQEILIPKFPEVNWDTFLSTCDIREIELVMATAVRRYLDENTEDVLNYTVKHPGGFQEELVYDQFGSELNAILTPYLIDKLKLESFTYPVFYSFNQYNTFSMYGNIIEFLGLNELPAGTKSYINHTGDHFDLRFSDESQCLIETKSSALEDMIQRRYAENKYDKMYANCVSAINDLCSSIAHNIAILKKPGSTESTESLLKQTQLAKAQLKSMVDQFKVVQDSRARIVNDCLYMHMYPRYANQLDDAESGNSTIDDAATGPSDDLGLDATLRPSKEEEKRSQDREMIKVAKANPIDKKQVIEEKETQSSSVTDTTATTQIERNIAIDHTKEKVSSNEKKQDHHKSQPFWMIPIIWLLNFLKSIKHWAQSLMSNTTRPVSSQEINKKQNPKPNPPQPSKVDSPLESPHRERHSNT